MDHASIWLDSTQSYPNEKSPRRSPRAKPAPPLSKTNIFVACQQYFRGLLSNSPFLCPFVNASDRSKHILTPNNLASCMCLPQASTPLNARASEITLLFKNCAPLFPVAHGIFLSAGHA